MIHDDPTAISDSTEESDYGSEGSEINDKVDSNLRSPIVKKQRNSDDSDVASDESYEKEEDNEAQDMNSLLINRED